MYLAKDERKKKDNFKSKPIFWCILIQAVKVKLLGFFLQNEIPPPILFRFVKGPDF